MAYRNIPYSNTSNLEGTFTPRGLNKYGRILEVTINNASWTPLPASALTDRNAIAIINRSGQEIKLNFNFPNTLPSTYTGVTVDNGSERFYDIKDTIVIYAKSQSSSCVVIVEELA